jgi:hypothetical protein
MVETRSVTGRRAVRLESFDDLLADADRIVAATESGRARTVGNWSPAQILQHVGRLIEFSLDGFPFRYSRWLRWQVRLVRLVSYRLLINLAFRAGFRNPTYAASLEPDPAVTLAEAAAYLRAQVDRVRKGERMTRPSPADGPTTHKQWVYAHLRHAELHFSFVELQGGVNGSAG